jgi:hypothetical protein
MLRNLHTSHIPRPDKRLFTRKVKRHPTCPLVYRQSNSLSQPSLPNQSLQHQAVFTMKRTFVSAALYTQGIIVLATAVFCLLKPDEFVANTGDIVPTTPMQLMHSLR